MTTVFICSGDDCVYLFWGRLCLPQGFAVVRVDQSLIFV